MYAEPTFFDIFSFELRRGNPETALDDPFSLVITPETKAKYFGNQPALGETLTLNDTLQFRVTGVLKEAPGPTHLPFDVLVSWSTWETLPEGRTRSWGGMYAYTYVLASKNVSRDEFQKQIAGLIPEPVRKGFAQMGMEVRPQLEPLTSIYLSSDRRYDIAADGNYRYVYIFAVAAVLILLIACANFVNLATARAIERAGEVGVRKSVGSSRRDLAKQFLTESLVTTGLAFTAALVITAITLPYFNELAGTTLSLRSLPLPVFGGLLAGGLLGVGLLAGGYPAFALSRFRPIDVLQGRFDRSSDGQHLRRGLVVFQFAITVFLIIGSLADEPTGNLQSTQSKMIMDWLKDLNETENVTIVQVTHNERWASYGDRVIRLKDGRVVEDSQVEAFEEG